MPVEHLSETQTAPREAILNRYSIEGNGYSWGKTARLRVEPAFLKVFENLKCDILAVDLCSSYPYLRQIMTGQHMQRMQIQARKLTGMLIDDLHAPARKNKLTFTEKLDPKIIVALRRELAPRKHIARELINAAIFQTLIDPPPVDKRDQGSISDALFERLMNSDVCLKNIIEPDGKPGDKGSWTFICIAKTGLTLPWIMESLLNNNDEAISFIKDMSNYVGSHLESEGKLKKVTFKSLDIVPLDILIDEAKKAFPPRMKQTRFFKSAQESDRHIQADVLNLPFAEKSIAFFSSIEGWPYYGKPLEIEGNIKVARQIREQLVRGGKAVFFPWAIYDNEDFLIRGSWFKQIEKEWTDNGLTIEREAFTADQLRAEMTDRELILAEHSPLLSYKGILTSLILSKPNL